MRAKWTVNANVDWASRTHSFGTKIHIPVQLDELSRMQLVPGQTDPKHKTGQPPKAVKFRDA